MTSELNVSGKCNVLDRAPPAVGESSRRCQYHNDVNKKYKSPRVDGTVKTRNNIIKGLKRLPCSLNRSHSAQSLLWFDVNRSKSFYALSAHEFCPVCVRNLPCLSEMCVLIPIPDRYMFTRCASPSCDASHMLLLHDPMLFMHVSVSVWMCVCVYLCWCWCCCCKCCVCVCAGVSPLYCDCVRISTPFPYSGVQITRSCCSRTLSRCTFVVCLSMCEGVCCSLLPLSICECAFTHMGRGDIMHTHMERETSARVHTLGEGE